MTSASESSPLSTSDLWKRFKSDILEGRFCNLEGLTEKAGVAALSGSAVRWCASRAKFSEDVLLSGGSGLSRPRSDRIEPREADRGGGGMASKEPCSNK